MSLVKVNFSFKKLRTRDKIYLLLLVLFLLYTLIAPLFLSQKKADKQNKSKENLTKTEEQTKINNSTNNSQDNNNLTIKDSKSALDVNKKIDPFPANFHLQSKDSFGQCDYIDLKNLNKKLCYNLDNKKYSIIINQKTYGGAGGAFNQVFNEHILAPYLNTYSGEVAKYNDEFYYIRDYSSKKPILIREYLIKKLSEYFKEKPELIEKNLNLIKSLNNSQIILLNENKFDSLSNNIKYTKQKNPTLNLTKKIYDKVIELYSNDPILQKLKNNYLILRIFEIGNVLENPETYVELNDENELYYPDLHYTKIISSSTGFTSYDNLVLDFYSTSIAKDGASPELLKKTSSYNNNYDSNSNSDNLGIYYNISYNDIIEQVKNLKAGFARNGMIELTTDNYKTPIMVGKYFLETYKKYYPYPENALDRAYEKALEIIYITDILFKDSLNHQTDNNTTPTGTIFANPASTNNQVSQNNKQPDSIWATMDNPEFKTLYDNLIKKMKPEPDNYLFNSSIGHYQTDNSETIEKQLEVNDSGRILAQEIK